MIISDDVDLSKEKQCRKKIKPKKVKKPSKSQLNKKADKEWSLSVKERAGWKCEYCGSTQYLNSHHVYGRRNMALRHDMDNGVCLCSGCHTFRNTFSAHQTPILFTLWFQKKYPDRYDRLIIKARSVIK